MANSSAKGRGGLATAYGDRLPERLVVEGYRHWLAGYEMGTIEPWELAWSLYARELGSIAGRRALGDLSCFVRTLRGCAGCPLRNFPFGAKGLCREECLAVGLVAACQHGDRLTCLACVDGFGCQATRGEIEGAAAQLAGTLRELGQVLLPVPAHVIDAIAGAQPPQLH